MPMVAMSSMPEEISSRRLAPVLWTLLGLFALRVSGQALVVFFHVPWLPSMREWYSGLLAYPILLPCQILIILVLGAACRDFTRGHGWFVTRRARAGRWATGFGSVYFAAMIVRYGVRMALHPEARWLSGVIPIAFHCVLATFLILVGRYHRGGGGVTPARA